MNAASPATGVLDHLSRRDFARLAEFIQGYSGIKMPANKITMVEGRLRRRVRALGLADFDEYCRHLFDQDGLKDEAVHLIDAVTTNKTEFFREPEHFELLAETILPELRAHRARNGRSGIKIWSAASSIGAEAYTLAMIAAEFARQTPGQRISILATDICTTVLKTAVMGIYPEQMIAPVPEELRRRYVLTAKDSSRGLVRIAPELRSLVQFGRLNLINPPFPIERDMDVVFCRNILIYFDKPTQQAVLRQLCEHLRPGGYLFLGHSESLAGFDLPLRTVGTTVFRRN